MSVFASFAFSCLRRISGNRIAAVSLIATTAISPRTADQRVAVTMDAQLRHQTIQGFGVPGARWPNYVNHLLS